MYKPRKLTRNAKKNPSLNCSSKYKPRGFVLGNCPQIQNNFAKEL